MTGAPPSLPPVFGVQKRRWWLVGIVAAWVVVLVGLSVWSVRHDRATVPEQRDIGAAVPELQRAAGVVFAAADEGERVVVLGPLELVPDCRITPVRRGVIAARDLTVYVRAGAARDALHAIADRLPGGFQPDVLVSRGGTRLGLHADAGDFIGIDSSADAGAKVLTLRLTSGCRPAGKPDESDPSPGPAPAELSRVLGALGAAAPAVTSRTVACPDGAVAGSYQVADVAMPAGFEGRLKTVSAQATVVRSDDSVWAYRNGRDSIVVTPEGSTLRIVAGSGC